MPAQPWFKFWPNDWLGDPDLQNCSSAARGLWIDMICLMHKSERRGFLQRHDAPMTVEQIALQTHRSAAEVCVQLEELRTEQVLSVSDSGIVYSRKMAREEQKREKCTKAGRRGGNPTLKGETQTTLKGQPKGRSKGRAPKTVKGQPLLLASDILGLDHPFLQDTEFRQLWDDWENHRIHKGHKLTPEARRGQLKKLAEMTLEDAKAALRHSRDQGYTGLWPPNGRGSGGRAEAGTHAPGAKHPDGTREGEFSEVGAPEPTVIRFTAGAPEAGGPGGGGEGGG